MSVWWLLDMWIKRKEVFGLLAGVLFRAYRCLRTTPLEDLAAVA